MHPNALVSSIEQTRTVKMADMPAEMVECILSRTGANVVVYAFVCSLWSRLIKYHQHHRGGRGARS
jgi:VanZ family protein